ncbi:MAG TPA: SPASM domain-containing protein [Phycisphaerae bacterium]|nr:SPASM domain-containing protein [Phycisphaerae bacterium]
MTQAVRTLTLSQAGPIAPTFAPGQGYRFHAMVKPIGSKCNLDCTYCYYLHKDDLLHQPAGSRMSVGLLAEHIRQYIEAQNAEEVIFSWQGGEPTLMGLDSFRRIVELQNQFRWYKRDFGKIHIDLFETAVAQSMGVPSQRCVTAEFCGKGLAVEHNGDVFSCDHYVYPEYKLGNIATDHEAAMAYSDRQKAFGFAKRETLPKYCRECSHPKLCWGECPKHRVVRTPDGEKGLNYLCPGLKRFYGQIQKDMPEILRRVSARG